MENSFINKILLESKEASENELVSLVKAYVNNFDKKTLKKLSEITIPEDLSYQGTVFRIINLNKKKLDNLLLGLTLEIKQEIVSYSKTMKGITQVYYNLKNDNENAFKNCVILKGTLSKKDSIIDIVKFDLKYPNQIHSGFTSYKEEQEVIGRNIFKNIEKKNIVLYCENGNFKK